MSCSSSGDRRCTRPPPVNSWSETTPNRTPPHVPCGKSCATWMPSCPPSTDPGHLRSAFPTRAGKAVRTRRAFPWSTGQARRTAPKPLPSGTIGGGPSCTDGAWGRRTQAPPPHGADFSRHSSNISGHPTNSGVTLPRLEVLNPCPRSPTNVTFLRTGRSQRKPPPDRWWFPQLSNPLFVR